MPRTKEAFEQIRAERKKQILRAAASVFARKGLAEATVADIASAASISHGLLYSYFTGKEEVFAALVEDALEEAKCLARETKGRQGTAWARLQWITQQMFPGQAPGRRPAYFLVVLYALTNTNVPEAVHEYALEQGEIIHDVICELITEGQARSEVIAGDAGQLATLYLACIQGLVLQTMYSRRPATTFPAMEMVLRVLRAKC